MKYDYLTPKFNQQQPAEIQTPNSQGTELNQSIQQSNQVIQPALLQPSTQSTTPQATPNNAIQRDTKDQVQPNTQQNQQIQPVQPTASQSTIVQPSGSSIAVRQAADFNDATVQSYWNEYQNGVNINDYQAQINALTAIDNYRATKGLKPIYTSNIYELTNQRTKKIENAVKDYENDIALAYNSGDYAMAQQIGQQLEDYKKMVNYQPTIDNAANYLNVVRYKSNWDNAINNIVQQLLTAQFTYNPSDDQALMKAQQYASNVVYESMNAKGILDSTMTTQMVTKTVNDLIPVYQKMAKEEFYENIERLQTMANFIIKLDDRDYSRWQDEVTMQLQRYEAKRKAISDEWDRVNTMGYVDNTASILLGVPVGTLSPSKRQAIDEAQAAAEKEYRKLQSDIALAEAKAQIDYQYGIQEYADKAAIDVSKSQTKANINVSEYAQKQAIKSAYEQTSPQSTSKAKQTNDNTNITNVENINTKTEDEIVNEAFNSMEQVFGKLDSNTAPYYAAEIQAGYNAGNIPDDIMLKLYSKIEKYINPTTSSNSKTANIVNNAMSPLAKRLANSK